MEDLRQDTAKPPIHRSPSTPPAWIGYTVLALLLGTIFLLIRQKPDALAPITTPHFQVEPGAGQGPSVLDKLTAPTPAPVPPLPEVRRAAPVLPTAVQSASTATPVLPTAPRAQLLHIRAIGTYENDRMPDGRILTTRYMGELASVANLPRGAHLGDMWFTRNDNHCWVLAPINAYTQSIGWVDP